MVKDLSWCPKVHWFDLRLWPSNSQFWCFLWSEFRSALVLIRVVHSKTTSPCFSPSSWHCEFIPLKCLAKTSKKSLSLLKSLSAFHSFTHSFCHFFLHMLKFLFFFLFLNGLDLFSFFLSLSLLWVCFRRVVRPLVSCLQMLCCGVVVSCLVCVCVLLDCFTAAGLI